MTSFEEALADWKKCSAAAIDARGHYDRVFAEATLVADGKNAEQRKAQADITAGPSWHACKVAETDAAVARARVDYLIAKASVTP